MTCSEPPGRGHHWTGRALAEAVGISLRSVQRIWDAHRLQPHRVRSFKRLRQDERDRGPALRELGGVRSASGSVDARDRGSTQARNDGCGPAVRFDEEAGALRSLAGRAPFGQLRDLTRKVQSDCAVDLDTNSYSVPWRLIGESV